MLIVLAAIGVIIVFIICFMIVQWWIARQRPTPQMSESARVHRTLENGARTLGGSDFLREYPPPEDPAPPAQDS